MVKLIGERSQAFRTALAAAPDLGATVPSCPEWTLLDLARHVGEGRQAWAATVDAGPSATTKAAPRGPAAPDDREALTDWVHTSTRQLLDALTGAGPDRGCWTWWAEAQSPPTVGAVARHQLQEIAVHTYDAQLTAGTAEPLPTAVALDGVEDFLFTCVSTTVPWPHGPATISYHAAEGCSWSVYLSAAGARVERGPATGATATGTGTGTASDLVLAFYGRVPLETLQLGGDRRVFDQIVAWDPSA